MSNYYPAQRHTLEMTTIQREQSLPEDAIGQVEARQGQSVNLRDIVAKGRLPSRFVIVDAAQFFKLRKPEELTELLHVEIGSLVAPNDVMASRKNRKLYSPIVGFVADIDGGRIIVQESPETVELEAGLDGQVIQVRPGRGAVIETSASVVQGAWGNNRRVIGSLKVEPEAGLESLFGENLDIQYRGSILVTRRSLRDTGLQVLEDQSLAGVIAPSMEADLIDRVMRLKSAVMLTEGFGAFRMNVAAFNLLTQYNGRQATLDTAQPTRWAGRYPEVIINPSGRGSGRAPRPNTDMTLEVGTNVRLTRLPNAGTVGKVVNLPKSPFLLENGLRVLCAEVETITGERLMVPLANLEVFGR
ncbi:MAG: hypothetical protein JNM70_10650 [Anaerolineae bacterium]|nr:hypothetical protein [Anaerolineae bacterium]